MSCYSFLFLECRPLVSVSSLVWEFSLGGRTPPGVHWYFLLYSLDFMCSPLVDFKNVKSSFSNKYAIVIGISLQFIVLPFLGFCAVKLFSNEFKSTAISVTLLVVTSR